MRTYVSSFIPPQTALGSPIGPWWAGWALINCSQGQLASLMQGCKQLVIRYVASLIFVPQSSFQFVAILDVNAGIM